MSLSAGGVVVEKAAKRTATGHGQTMQLQSDNRSVRFRSAIRDSDALSALAA